MWLLSCLGDFSRTGLMPVSWRPLAFDCWLQSSGVFVVVVVVHAIQIPFVQRPVSSIGITRELNGT